MNGDEILLFMQLQLRKFNLLHGSVMHCHACYNLSNTQQQCSLPSHDMRKLWYRCDCDITEITHVLGLKVISLEIHSDLNIVGDIMLCDVLYRRQFFKITLVLGSA